MASGRMLDDKQTAADSIRIAGLRPQSGRRQRAWQLADAKLRAPYGDSSLSSLRTSAQRLDRARREYGTWNLVLYAFHRGLSRLLPAFHLERFYVVAQPVTEAVASLRGQSLTVRELVAGDPCLTVFQRTPGEIEDRFRQRATGLGAFADGQLVGWIWVAFEQFQEYELPLRFELPASGTVSWDMDVFVRPDYRLRPVFPRLWESATGILRQRGVRWTCSLISAYNPASRSAHRRLGATELGSITLIHLGQLRVIIGGRLGPRLSWSRRDDFKATVVIPDLA